MRVRDDNVIHNAGPYNLNPFQAALSLLPIGPECS
jgi:hypothetical protein